MALKITHFWLKVTFKSSPSGNKSPNPVALEFSGQEEVGGGAGDVRPAPARARAQDGGHRASGGRQERGGDQVSHGALW